MVLCRSHGFGNAEGMRLCGMRVDAAVARARCERKVVTVLFCDLVTRVGFTAAADDAGPRRYSRHCRTAT